MATAKKIVKSKPVATKTKAVVKKAVVTKKPMAKPAVKTKAPVKSKAPVKTTAKKVVRRTAAAAPADIKPVKVKVTTTQIIQRMSEKYEIAPKALKGVFADLERLIAGSLKKGGVGSIALLGFTFKGRYKPPVKIEAIKKGTMVKNPFNGGKEEPHKGRPAGVRPGKMVLKAIPRKPMKDAVAI